MPGLFLQPTAPVSEAGRATQGGPISQD